MRPTNQQKAPLHIRTKFLSYMGRASWAKAARAKGTNHGKHRWPSHQPVTLRVCILRDLVMGAVSGEGWLDLKMVTSKPRVIGLLTLPFQGTSLSLSSHSWGIPFKLVSITHTWLFLGTILCLIIFLIDNFNLKLHFYICVYMCTHINIFYHMQIATANFLISYFIMIHELGKYKAFIF